MASREQIELYELLTRTGRGTPMGETMRRYWVPALMSSEIAEPDGPPVRVKLMGEDLVAFRDTEGRVGLLDEYCPHRRASLWFGRNEECGLRCVYHGWKFDVEGNCLDQMNEPPENQFMHKVRIAAYPTCELGGLVWAYLGPPEKMPASPKFAWTQVPPTHRHVSKLIQDCNWLQGLEGGLDTSHAPILHRLLSDKSERGGIRPSVAYVRASAPRTIVDITDYGYLYTGIRELGPAEMHVRTYHFILPFHQIRAFSNEVGGNADAGHIWVPMDDEKCMVYNWAYSRTEAPLTEEERAERWLGNGPDHVDQTTFRARLTRENDYLIDRAVQKTETFTGIDGINTQDRVVQETMGAITDRSKEHLGPADKAVIQMRRVLRQAVKSVETGGDPAGLAPTYYNLYCSLEVLPRGADWRQLLAPEITGEKILETV